MFTRLTLGLFAAFLAFGISTGAKATLLGQDVICEVTVPGSWDCDTSSAVVEDGTEFQIGSGDPWAFSIDVADSSFVITNISGVNGLTTDYTLTLSGLIWAEDDTATIDSTSEAWVGVLASGDDSLPVPDLSVDNAITFEFASLSWGAGSTLTVTITPTPHEAVPVPEPSTFWLFSLGLALVFWWSRHGLMVPVTRLRRHHIWTGRYRPSPNPTTV